MKQRKNRSVYRGTWRIWFTVILLPVLIFITFVHNASLSQQTRSRDFLYSSWVTLTKNTSMFDDVRDRDALISKTQNDAYESNAGSFYYFTGKRLTYIYQPQNLWPEINNPECTIEKDCLLPPASTRVLSVIPNLLRNNGFPNPISRMSYGDDWVNQLLEPGALAGMNFWVFEIVPMTPNTIASFLIPLESDSKTDYLELGKTRFITLSKVSQIEFTPALNNICLETRQQTISTQSPFGTLFLREWVIPIQGRAPSGTPIEVPARADLRSIQLGSCA